MKISKYIDKLSLTESVLMFQEGSESLRKTQTRLQREELMMPLTAKMRSKCSTQRHVRCGSEYWRHSADQRGGPSRHLQAGQLGSQEGSDGSPEGQVDGQLLQSTKDYFLHP